MSDNIRKKVLIVGAGTMTKEYIKVLKAMNVDFEVIGNSEDRAKALQDETGATVHFGGLEKYIAENEVSPNCYFINATNVTKLGFLNLYLLRHGCKHILSEKPGMVSLDEGYALLEAAKEAEVYIAYNRRFYASSLAAARIIEEDGGVTSFNIEFTEWRHVFDQLGEKDYLDKLVLANSTHVIDMAFFLSGGKVDSITSIIKGQNDISWHKCGSVYGGVGTTDKGQIFTYSANWDAPGRWAAELNTRNHRLIFRPLEKLQLQDKGSVKIYEPEVDYSFDEKYKPGLYKEVQAFLNDNAERRLCTLQEQVNNLKFYSKISGEEI